MYFQIRVIGNDNKFIDLDTLGKAWIQLFFPFSYK